MNNGTDVRVTRCPRGCGGTAIFATGFQQFSVQYPFSNAAGASVPLLPCFVAPQFFYGEDGIDVISTSYMKQFGFLARNAERFAQQLDLGQAVAVSKVRFL